MNKKYHLTKQIWGTMNDDQRVWIVGSFLHFACNEGFTELKGYDLSEADAKGMMAGAYTCVLARARVWGGRGCGARVLPTYNL